MKILLILLIFNFINNFKINNYNKSILFEEKNNINSRLYNSTNNIHSLMENILHERSGIDNLSCGFEYIFINKPFTASYTCVCLKYVNRYELSINKQDITPNTISIDENYGLLRFMDYFLYPEIIITVKAITDYGNYTKDMKVIINNDQRYKFGVKFHLTNKYEFTCLDGPNSADSHEDLPEFTGIIDDINNLYTKREFDLKFPFIDTYNVKYFTLEFSGLFYASYSSNFTFYCQAEHGAELLIDDIPVIINYRLCDGYDHIFQNEIYLEEGYHNIYIKIYQGKSSNDDWKVKFSYFVGYRNVILPLKILIRTNDVLPLIYLKSPLKEINLLENHFVNLPLSAEYGVPNSCISYPLLPKGLYLYDLNIRGIPTEIQDYKEYSIICENSISICNKIIIKLKISSI